MRSNENLWGIFLGFVYFSVFYQKKVDGNFLDSMRKIVKREKKLKNVKNIKSSDFESEPEPPPHTTKNTVK